MRGANNPNVRFRPKAVIRELLDSEGTGQLAVGMGLREQGAGLCLERLHRVGASSEAGWRLLERDELHDSVGKFGGITGLLPIHALPGRDDLLGSLRVVVNGGLGVGGRRVAKQLGAKETWLD